MRSVARRRRTRAGYTLVEVMMAIGILSVSAVALLSVQEAVARGNTDARQIATATQIMRSVGEDLRLDALNWRSSTLNAMTFNMTRFLRDVPTAATAAPSAWLPLGQTTGAPERFRDYSGAPTADPANMFFCVQSRFAWIFTGTLLRADVRVWWVRPGADRSAFAGCPNITDVDARTQLANLRFVQSAFELRYTPAPIGTR